MEEFLAEAIPSRCETACTVLFLGDVCEGLGGMGRKDPMFQNPPFQA